MDTLSGFYSDAELVAALQQQGQRADDAIRDLYRSYFESLRQYVLHNSGSGQDAEDLFQEVLIAFIKLVQAGRFRGEASIKTFLFALNRNLWLNELKRRGRASKREQHYEDMNERQARLVDEAMTHRQNSANLMNVVNQLGESCKKILVLFYYENRSMREILNELNYENEQVVRNKKYKCLKKLTALVHSDKNLYHQLKNLLHG